MNLIDTNVLIYSFEPSLPFYRWAKKSVFEAISSYQAFVNPVILSELGVGDQTPSTLEYRLTHLGIRLIDLPYESSLIATLAYKKYLENRIQAGVKTSSKIPLPDFFIGAHAQYMNYKIITADIGRYKTYFPKVKLIHPF